MIPALVRSRIGKITDPRLPNFEAFWGGIDGLTELTTAARPALIESRGLASARWSIQSGQVVFQREAYRPTPPGHFNLFVDRPQVRVNRAWADRQLLSNLRVGEPLREQPQHLELTFGQAGWICGCGWC